MMSFKTVMARRKIQKIVHMILQLTALCLGVVGICAVFKYHDMVNQEDMFSMHAWIGLITFCLFCLQWLFGMSAFMFPGASTTTRARMLPWHVCGGRALLYMAICTALTGLMRKFTFLTLKDHRESRLINFTGLSILLFGIFVDLSVALARYVDNSCACMANKREGLAFKSDNKFKIFKLHPLFMIIGFILIGGEYMQFIFTTVAAKRTTQKTIHWVLYVTALVSRGLGIYAVFKFYHEKGFPRMYTLHSWLDIITISLYALQREHEIQRETQKIDVEFSPIHNQSVGTCIAIRGELSECTRDRPPTGGTIPGVRSVSAAGVWIPMVNGNPNSGSLHIPVLCPRKRKALDEPYTYYIDFVSNNGL
ncbi:hypothetical protein Dsin_009124 [Dipteronia sinensis]|uniref:Cytochrome b561 domain-containing protein n=1 Tax=Dipteronia sinensis TaxID=43782 RepID=A0AAE0EBL6_9ROSI|nr:hypothetical protein Dsin_009124 [Dipteronia sinensis]